MKRTNHERVKAGFKSVKRAVGRREAKTLGLSRRTRPARWGFWVCCFPSWP